MNREFTSNGWEIELEAPVNDMNPNKDNTVKNDGRLPQRENPPLPNGALTPAPIDGPDGRIKSPDDFLKMMALKKKGIALNPKVEPSPTSPPSPEKFEKPKILPRQQQEILRDESTTLSFSPKQIHKNEKPTPMEISRDEFGIPELSTIKNALESEHRKIQEKKMDAPEDQIQINGALQIENSKVMDDTDAFFQTNLETHAQSENNPRPTSPTLIKREHLTNIESEVEMAELRARATKENAQWREYAQNVKHWQAQVLEIVQKLKKELNKAKQEQNEVQGLRETLRQKEEEIRRLRSNQKSGLFSWMKNFTKAPAPNKGIRPPALQIRPPHK